MTVVGSGFRQLVDDSILVFDSSEARCAFLAGLDKSLNRPWLFWLCLSLPVLIYFPFAVQKHDCWNSNSGGAPAWWFRLWATVNVYFLVHIAVKSVITARAMQRCFQQKVMLQPLHPDGCGWSEVLGRHVAGNELLRMRGGCFPLRDRFRGTDTGK